MIDIKIQLENLIVIRDLLNTEIQRVEENEPNETYLIALHDALEALPKI